MTKRFSPSPPFCRDKFQALLRNPLFRTLQNFSSNFIFHRAVLGGECSWHSARGGRIFKDCRRIRYEYFVRGLYLRSKNYLGLEARVVGLFRNSARDHHPVRASPGLLEIAGTLHRGCGGEVAAQFSVALPKLRIDTERTKNELYRNRPPPNRPNCAKKKTNEIVFPYII